MLDSWTEVAGNTLLFEKEALPIGEFAKWTDGNEVQEITVKQEYLDRLLKDFNKFKSQGIRVPLFKTHKEDPDNDRGTIEDLSIKPNSKGVASLHLKVKFNDEKARDQGIHNDVSVMCPPKFVDTQKNVYNFALRHVALTSVPVIPGLDPFTPIILSFDTPSGLQLSKDNSIMNLLDEILTALEIKAEDGVDDAGKKDLILAKFKSSKGKTVGELNLSYPPLVMNQTINGRKAIIDGLVKDEAISIAQGKDLEKEFCSKEAVTQDLALSQEQLDNGGTEFDRRIEWTKKLNSDRPLKKSGRGEPIKMAREDGKDNPLVEDAKKRAELAKARA